MFMKFKPRHIEEFFDEIYIPINCEFFIVQEDENNQVMVSEVYRVAPYLPLEVRRLDETSKSNLYLRRNKLNGLVLRSVLLPMKSFGVQFKNGSWDGLVGVLTRGEADVTSDALQITRERLEYVDYLISIMKMKFYVYIKKPGISTNWDNILNPFDRVMWSTILVAIVTISACLSACWYIATRSSALPLWYILHESVFRIIGNFCNQGFDMNIKYSACRTILVTSYLTTTVLLAAYSAALISSLTVQDLKLPFTTFIEMLRIKQLKLELLAGTAHVTFFNVTTDPVLKGIFHKMIAPGLTTMPSGTLTGLNKICNQSNYAFFTSDYGVRSHESLLPCKIVPVPQTSFESSMCMVIAKDSPYKNILNYYTKQLMRTGILKRLYRESFNTEDESSQPSYQELDIQATLPLLAILGVGAVISVFVLVLEIMIHQLSVLCPRENMSINCTQDSKKNTVQVRRIREKLFRRRVMRERQTIFDKSKKNVMESKEQILKEYRITEEKNVHNVLSRTLQLSEILCPNEIKY
ncbi:hypothetical protein L9F63_001322 [Diploptera punctata]|uniref:Uncharacterized protein n=1 Tax=Diploptera punctata TaxID=6984 RepID=A0AAD8EJD2_DIPPU|nr:hypothetical protein L9F63_001322 [Diploptera punctata]